MNSEQKLRKIENIRRALARRVQDDLIKQLLDTQEQLKDNKLDAEASKELLAKMFAELPLLVEKAVAPLRDLKIDWSEMPQKDLPEIFKIDWSGMPKLEMPKSLKVENQISERAIFSPIVTATKAVEGVLQAIQGILQTMLDKFIAFITEPDEIIYSEDRIVEFYGKRQVVYTFKKSGKETRVLRNES